jgi:hypothetical protein
LFTFKAQNLNISVDLKTACAVETHRAEGLEEQLNLVELRNCIGGGGSSRDGSVGIATSYGLDDRGVGVLVPVGSRILSSPRRPDRLWGPPSLLSNGYRRLFPRG